MTGRRDFLHAVASTAAALLANRAGWSAEPAKPKLRKAIKYTMVAGKGTNKEKLALVKACGFEGVEIDSPSGLDLDDLAAAAKETGVIIHGVIDSVHWSKPFSSPDESVRAAGFDALKTALNDAAKVGADTVLVVPGVVKNEVTFEQCWERSQAEIRKALPLAKKLKVKIAIEVVWNNFITKPEQLVKYVDEFHSHEVGAYFDASNMLKYGVASAEWIRKLGKRMLKLDFKAYSAAKAKEAGKEGAGFGVGIGEGDEDWPEILKALAEVGYSGWFTAEVKGGDEAWLKDVSARMDRILAGR
jgi:hexulose-6-phosphate isomerase